MNEYKVEQDMLRLYPLVFHGPLERYGRLNTQSEKFSGREVEAANSD